MTIKESLQKSAKTLTTKKIGSASLDTELLLLHALNQSKNKPNSFRNDRSWLIAHNDCVLTTPQENKFFNLIKRREKFEPVAYIIGKKEFFGLEFEVNKNVLIPRPETEIIVEESLKDIMAESVTKKDIITIADIGTGSGAIAISLSCALKEKNISNKCVFFASDISSSALRIAKKNAREHNCGRDIIFKKGNLLEALPKNIKIDHLLANLPYISEQSYQKLTLRKKIPLYRIETGHEPKKALLADKDGLKYFNEFFRELPEHAKKNTKILLESDPHQIPAIIKLTQKYLPIHKITVIKDLRGLDRITKIEIL